MKIDQLRKIIKEEVKAAMKEELKDILTEAVKIASDPNVNLKGNVGNTGPKAGPKAGLKGNMGNDGVEDPTLKFSKLVNEERKPLNNPQFETKGNPVLEALNHTAASGEWRTLNGGSYNAGDAVGWSGGGPMGASATPVVNSVEEMIGNKRTSDINAVSIDAVPDFSNLMGNLKEKGKL